MSVSRGALLGAILGFALAALASAATLALVVISAAALGGALAGRRWGKTPTDLLLVRLLLAAVLTVSVVANTAFLGPLVSAAIVGVSCLVAGGAVLERHRCREVPRRGRDERPSV
jgi:hypothetical protein